MPFSGGVVVNRVLKRWLA